MGEAPRLYTIPAHLAFADSLVAGLIDRTRGDAMALARALVLLPNNRAVRAVTDAFVRASGGALLLPRLVPLGNPEAGESVGAALDAADLTGAGADPPPPAVGPYARRLILTRLTMATRPGTGAAEAVRLAGELERVLDQLLVEEVEPDRLVGLDMAEELSAHWQASLASLDVVLARWPEELARLGRIDAARRRGRLLDRLDERWRERPPATLVCAAGISDPAPAVARLLRCVAGLPQGLVVFAGLDTGMPVGEWASLGPHAADAATGRAPRSIETHSQFVPKLMLDRIGVGRDEVAPWPHAAGPAADAAREQAIGNALAPAAETGKWTALKPSERRLAGVTAAEFAIPGDEAQAIALALRGALETPGRTAALVTPDRGLARRVAAHCRRWGIEIDDSAGRPLSILPPGTLLLALVEAAVERFAPLPLLTLLKHPLATGGGERAAWLDGVRRLDRRLRGPRPRPGLAGIDDVAGPAASWWAEARDLLAPVEAAMAVGDAPLADLLACLREAAGRLAGDALWAEPAGRAAATFFAALEAEAPAGPPRVDPRELPALLRTLLDEVAVRRPPGRDHPRLAIYGQIEARLQSADLMILGGLNEGTWPGTPAPDPWLAPRIRASLGLPGLERRIGIAAQDLAQAMGAPRVLLTRSRRDAGGPTLPSRFWLRLQAMAGEGFVRDAALEDWTRLLDDPGEHRPAGRPAPSPRDRPTQISVTEVDRLKADPFAFYARRCLGLSPLDAVDAEPSAAWRGSEVHRVLEAWWEEDCCAPGTLREKARAMLDDEATHPIVRALWQPRLMEAIDWIAGEVEARLAAGRRIVAAEGKGRIEVAGVTLTGRFDRIDALPGGGIAVVDYKTGKAPSVAAVRAGFSLQLGLLGLIAERGGFDGIAGPARAFEYWSLAKNGDRFGKVTTPTDDAGKRDRIPTDDFVGVAAENFAGAAARWLTGREAFTAKLVPEYATYADYDQLMRRDEWYGRE